MEKNVLTALADRNYEERCRIDAEIRKLQGKILELRTARNRTTPVARLPTELLTRVFALAKKTNPSGCWRLSLTVSWVCRDWRDKVLNYPWLWNYIDHPHPGLVQAFMERTGEARIAIDTLQVGPQSLSSIPLFLEALPRLAAMNLGPRGETIICGPEWRAPAPILNQLGLINITLSHNIFSGTYPSLRSLSLIQCTATGWDQFPISPHLIILRVISPSEPASTAHIIEILQSLPNLEFLDLRDALVVEGGSGLNDQTRIPLLSLRKIQIRCEAHRIIVSLFSRITISPDANILLLLDLDDLDEVSQTVAAVRGSRLKPTWQIDSLVVNTKGNFCLRIEETNAQQRSSTSFEFILGPGLAEALTAQHIMDLCHSLHLATLQSLDIEGKLRYDATLWTTLGALPNLRSLTIRDQLSSHFLRYLKEEAQRLVSTDQMRDTPGSPQHRPTFQTLHTLVLQDLRHTPPNHEDITCLRWALGPRKIYIERLPKLVLVGAQLPEELLASFGHVVGEVSQLLDYPRQGGFRGRR